MSKRIIIYDDNCPLCSAYTTAFVKTGFIDKEGRKDFSTIPPELLNKIDLHKSVNEIPLIDTQHNQVWYGIDALLEILGQKFPLIKTIGNIAPIKYLLQKLYKFISYNRRVIVAAPKKEGFDCSPDFNVRYRLLFLFVFLLFNSWMLFPLQDHVLNKSVFNSNIVKLQAVHFIFVFINISIGFSLNKRDGLEYLGQINMIALMAMLFCIPVILVNKWMVLQDGLFNSFYFGMLAFFVLHEYFRRMRYIGFNRKYKWILVVNICSLLVFVAYMMF
jgi:predicted DCC family thiol-disulfide oxidoreductase YuxK